MSTEVLIPHLKRTESLRRALGSLQTQSQPPDVCVIDNSATQQIKQSLGQDFPDVRVLALGRNHGFGAAINRGVRSSTADLVVLLNDDAVADRRFIEELHAERARSGAEMIAGCMRMQAGSVESLGIEVDRSLVAYDIGYGKPYPEYPARSDPMPLGPSGGAAAFDRAAFERMGGFDEAMFAYLEDVELAIRMRAAGMRCASAWRAFVWHEHSSTLGSGSGAKNRLMGRNREYILWKHGRQLSTRDSLRGAAMDAVVYAGQAVVDRNFEALRGRVDTRRLVRGRQRPPGDPVPETLRVRRSAVRGLALRRSRRA